MTSEERFRKDFPDLMLLAEQEIDSVIRDLNMPERGYAEFRQWLIAAWLAGYGYGGARVREEV